MTATIACIGAAHIDHKAHAEGAVRLGASNPVRFDHGLGGVARNVAESLARLKCRVGLASRVGRDADGDRVVAALDALDVDTSMITRSDSRPTAGYTALIDGTGELVVAMSDAAIYDEITPEVVAPLLPALAEWPVWFLDANLPEAALATLLDRRPSSTVLVAVGAVSVAKSTKLEGRLDRIDILFTNRDEIGRMAQMEIRAPLDICEAANRLRCNGVGTVVVSRGPAGCFVASDKVYDFFPAVPATVRDVTGAGDALTAGTLYGQASGQPIDKALHLGLACAALAIESTASVNPALTPALLRERAGVAA